MDENDSADLRCRGCLCHNFWAATEKAQSPKKCDSVWFFFWHCPPVGLLKYIQWSAQVSCLNEFLERTPSDQRLSAGISWRNLTDGRVSKTIDKKNTHTHTQKTKLARLALTRLMSPTKICRSERVWSCCLQSVKALIFPTPPPFQHSR